MKQPKKVGIWIRVSTDFQVKDESPEHHEKRARYYAEAKDWDVAEVYRLDAVSGKSIIDQPEAKRMLRDIRSGHITGLIFSKLARLARNTKELLEFADIFKECNADLISLQESIDTSTPAGRLFYTMIAAMAQWEREEISERVAASVPVRARMGKQTGGAASFGYEWKDKRLAPSEKEAPVRKLMYELFIKYRRRKAIATKLNEMGHRTRNGSKFTVTTIDRLLRDPTAKGQRIANYTQSLGNNKKWVTKPKEDWIIVPCPAIVSEDLWNECNSILDAQFNSKKRPGRTAKHLLSGFVHCTCGKKMYVYYETSATYKCKPCKVKVGESDLDDIFHTQLKSFLLNDTDPTEYLHQSNTLISERTTLLFTLQKEQAKLIKDVDQYIKLRVQEELTREQFATYCKPLQEQLTQVQERIPQLEAEIDFLKIQQLSSDTILQEATDLYSRWGSMAFEERRGIVELITDKIIVGKTDINLSLAYTPSLENAGNSSRNFKDSYSQ